MSPGFVFLSFLGERPILIRKTSHYLHIFTLLSVLIILAVSLTFFLMMIFWHHSIAKQFTVQVERRFADILKTENFVPDRVRLPENSMVTAFHEGILEKTGAIAMYFQKTADGSKSLVASRNSAGKICHARIATALSQALHTRTGKWVLCGFSWNMFLPASKYLIAARPLPVRGAVALVYPLEPVYRTFRNQQKVILGYLAINIVLLIALGGYFIYRSLVRPINELVRLSNAYDEDGDMPYFIHENVSPFGQLSVVFNKMLRRIDRDRQLLKEHVNRLEDVNRELVATQEEVIRAEKLASVGRLAAGMAHEIGNPLGVIQGYLSLLRNQDLAPSERHDYADRSTRELERINRLVQQLLDFSRMPKGTFSEVSIHELLYDFLKRIESHHMVEKIDIVADFQAANDVVVADPDQMQQVFLNCFLNSVDALAEDGVKEKKISLRTDNLCLEKKGRGNQYVMISIIDSGAGIADHEIDKLFDPFFTTKEPGKGTGLGLSVVYAIIQGHGGSVTIQSKKNRGTTVSIRLPVIPKDCNQSQKNGVSNG